MTTTNNNINTKFEFRTKFKKLLKEENEPCIIKAFENFCKLESKDALEVLWRMTYSSEAAWIEIYNIGLDQECISVENILSFRNELRYQYEQLVQTEFTSFGKNHLDKKIQEAYKRLENRTDSIVASVIYDYCHETLDMPLSEISRILFLLNSDKENNYFGGIRSMKFNEVESDYLKAYHIEIHNLLSAINTYSNEEDVELPFYMEGEEEEEAVVEEVIHNTNELLNEKSEENHECYEYKALTPEEILLHKQPFESFVNENDFNLLVVIGQLGFDLNEVMIKREEILNFINAANTLLK